MARLRNIHNGAVISCTDEKAARMGGEWVPADKPTPAAKPKPKKPKK